MPINRKIYVGSGIKVRIVIASDGFDMAEDEFQVRIYTSANRLKIIDKSQMRLEYDSQGRVVSYVFAFNTKDLGPGTYYMETTAWVPDADFNRYQPSGFRVEIDKKMLCIVDP